MAYAYAFAEFAADNMTDWLDWVKGSGTTYNSYLETGYDTLQDPVSEKETNTIYCFFQATETSVSNLGPPIVYDKPSSCLMRAKWQWADSASSNRWSEQKEAYRIDPRLEPESTGAYDYGFDVVQTINQVRGKGRSLQLRFDSNGTNDFHLLGWSIPYTVITGA